MSGVELFRSCTAEPRATGIIWSVEKDITRYYSLLMNNQTLAVYLGNVVDSTYTGVYHVNITFHFYPAEDEKDVNLYAGGRNLGTGYDSKADLIVPISRNLPLNDGLWFEIENATDIQSKEVRIPRNAYRAVLEVYVSFHENDEFWYSNLPNDYIRANNLSGTPGNGPFREVLVSVDGVVVGAIWPFTVIYTGGINPLLWRPITGIGSFDLPSYDIEITPFLEKILDGKMHLFGFFVTKALNVWYVDANLHLWLDSESTTTEGKLLMLNNPSPNVSVKSDFKGLDGTFFTAVSRSVSSSGWVKSSHGKVVTNWNQEFNYRNTMVMGNDGNLQIVDQLIDFNDSMSAKFPSSSVYSAEVLRRFPLYLYSNYASQGNGTYLSIANLSLGFNEKKFRDVGSGLWKSSLKSKQEGEGIMVVKNNLVVSGVGSTQEAYNYDSNEFCYFRNVSSSNYTILSDKAGNTCNHRTLLPLGSRFDSWSPYPAQRASVFPV